MKLVIVSVGTRMPRWVDEGFREYAKRLSAELKVKLVEIPAGHRGKGADPARAVRDEGARMLKALPDGCRVVALDVGGDAWSTEALAGRLDAWMGEGRDVAFLVGGPEGLAAPCLERADLLWSLSALTLPHPLVRVVVAEQFYRAWSLLRNHPYHRA